MKLKIARLCASLLAVWVLASLAVAEGAVPVLKTKTERYANVTLVSRTATHVFVRHSLGVATLKISDLDVSAQQGLGLLPSNAGPEGSISDSPSHDGAVSKSNNRMTGLAASALSSLREWKGKWLSEGKGPQFNRQIVLVILAGFAFAFLFFSYCLMLICKKTGNEPGVLVWLPVLQVFPMLRAAGMSGWWFLALFVPVLSLVAQILWCVKIAQARGRGVFTAILLILPITNILAFMYLAFADGNNNADQSRPRSIQTEPIPA